ncbi:MAG: hypothetical protein WCR21_09265 [Bacteroidota bacterium]
MKTKSILIFLLFSIIFSSCGKHFNIEKRHYRKGFYFAQNHKAVTLQTSAANKAPKLKESHPDANNQKMHGLEPVQPNQNLVSQNVKPDSPKVDSQSTKALAAQLQHKALVISNQLALTKKFDTQLNNIFKHQKQATKKGVGAILLDFLLIFIGLAASVILFILSAIFSTGRIFSGGAGGSVSKDQLLATIFFISGLVCIVVPIVMLIRDLK